MKVCSLLVVVLATVIVVIDCGLIKRETTTPNETIAEEEARILPWVDQLSTELNLKKNRGTIASWNYASNITDENQKASNEVSAELAAEYKASDFMFVVILQWFT